MCWKPGPQGQQWQWGAFKRWHTQRNPWAMWARGAWKRLEGLVSLWHPVLRHDPFLTPMLPPWGDAANSALTREKPVPVWWPGASGLHEISLPWGIYCSNKEQTDAIAKATDQLKSTHLATVQLFQQMETIYKIIHMDPKLCTKLNLKWVKDTDVRQRTVRLGKKFKPHVLLTFVWGMVSYFVNMTLVHTHKKWISRAPPKCLIQTSKSITKNLKGQTTDLERNFANHFFEETWV